MKQVKQISIAQDVKSQDCGKLDGNFESTNKIQNKKRRAVSSEKRLHNQQTCPRRPDSQERTHGGKKQRGGKRGKGGMMDVDEGMRRTVRRVSRPADGESKRSACVRACRSSPPVTALS